MAADGPRAGGPRAGMPGADAGGPGSLLDAVRGRRVLFLGGKGGVGKTTLASAVALALAREGRRVLLASTDPAHNLGHLWDARLADEPYTLWTPGDDDAARRPAAAGPGGDPLRSGGAARAEGGPGARGAVVGVEVDPDAVAAAHLDAVSATVRGMMPEHLHAEVDRYFRLAAASPGTQEAALLERISALALEGVEEHDVVVFDTAPTGHTLRLLDLPQLMGAWTDGLLGRRERSERFSEAMRGLEPRGGRGRARTAQEARDARIREVLEARKSLFERMHALLTDPARTGFVAVLTAERMPVLETLALHRQLSETGVDVAALAVNRMTVPDGGEVLAARAAAEAQQVRVLAEALPEVPLLRLPWVEGTATGPAEVGRMADVVSHPPLTL